MKRNNRCVWVMLVIMSFILAFTACGKAPSGEQVKALIAKRLPFDWPGVQIESIGAIEFGEKIGETWEVKTKVRYVRSKKKYDDMLRFRIKKDDSGMWFAEFAGYARGY